MKTSLHNYIKFSRWLLRTEELGKKETRFDWLAFRWILLLLIPLILIVCSGILIKFAYVIDTNLPIANFSTEQHIERIIQIEKKHHRFYDIKDEDITVIPVKSFVDFEKASVDEYKYFYVECMEKWRFIYQYRNCYYLCSDTSIDNNDRENISKSVKNGELYVEYCSGLFLSMEKEGELVGLYNGQIFDAQLRESISKARDEFMESNYYYDYLGSHLVMRYD